MGPWNLSSTEAVTVDLIALRNWHFRCSLDRERTSYMRKWHRSQVTAINKRIPRTGPGSLNLVKVVLIEHLASQARKGIHVAIASATPFNWRSFCEAVTKELEGEQGYERDDSLHTSSECGNEGKEAASSPEGSGARKSAPAGAKALNDVPPLEE